MEFQTASLSVVSFSIAFRLSRQAVKPLAQGDQQHLGQFAALK